MNPKKQPLKRDFWRPDEHRLWVRKQPRWGWGWTINWAGLARRLRSRRR